MKTLMHVSLRNAIEKTLRLEAFALYAGIGNHVQGTHRQHIDVVTTNRDVVHPSVIRKTIEQLPLAVEGTARVVRNRFVDEQCLAAANKQAPLGIVTMAQERFGVGRVNQHELQVVDGPIVGGLFFLTWLLGVCRHGKSKQEYRRSCHDRRQRSA